MEWHVEWHMEWHMEWHVEWHIKAIFRLSQESLGSTTDLKIDWIWHLLLKIEAGVIGPTLLVSFIPFTPL